MSAEAKGLSRYAKPRMRERAGVAPKAYTITELATAYSLSRSKICAEIAAGRLKAHKLGPRAVRITSEEAERWFNSYGGAKA